MSDISIKSSNQVLSKQNRNSISRGHFHSKKYCDWFPKSCFFSSLLLNSIQVVLWGYAYPPVARNIGNEHVNYLSFWSILWLAYFDICIQISLGFVSFSFWRITLNPGLFAFSKTHKGFFSDCSVLSISSHSSDSLSGNAFIKDLLLHPIIPH